MFVMFDMYVKLPPGASPIAVNKLYNSLFTIAVGHTQYIVWSPLCVAQVGMHEAMSAFLRTVLDTIIN